MWRVISLVEVIRHDLIAAKEETGVAKRRN
jgi:hypothetical protein